MTGTGLAAAPPPQARPRIRSGPVADLFDSSTPDDVGERPGPLADRLRPARLADVMGQDHSRSGRPAGRDAAVGDAVLADPLGTARGWQDHDRAAARARDRPAFRAGQRHLHRRLGPQKGVRGGQAAAPAGPRHAAVRRRDPSLQQGSAGRLSAAYGGWHDPARRRDDGESVVRAERRPALARTGAGPRPAVAGRPGASRGARRSRTRRAAAARCAGPGGDARDGRRRRPGGAEPRRADRRLEGQRPARRPTI